MGDILTGYKRFCHASSIRSRSGACKREKQRRRAIGILMSYRMREAPLRQRRSPHSQLRGHGELSTCFPLIGRCRCRIPLRPRYNPLDTTRPYHGRKRVRDPWRQVEAMSGIAAERVNGISRSRNTPKGAFLLRDRRRALAVVCLALAIKRLCSSIVLKISSCGACSAGGLTTTTAGRASRKTSIRSSRVRKPSTTRSRVMKKERVELGTLSAPSNAFV